MVFSLSQCLDIFTKFSKKFQKNVDSLIYSAIIAPILSELRKITDIPQ
ncbi:hypothetical protein AO364_1734 [Moraxella catarrhalis]|nr:hypothetical protein AO364_1734 [Moraxella catarrhalis]